MVGRLGVLAILGLLSVAGCKRAPEPENRPAPSAATPASPASPHAEPPAAAPAAAGHLAWDDPKGWTRVSSPSPMRLATYKLPRAPGVTEDAEMTVFHFGGGQGGSVEANFDRWLSQFSVDKSAAQRSEREAHGMKVHLLEIPKGTFTSAMRPGDKAEPRDGYGLLGAVVETPGGPYFFKITGPAKTLAEARPTFIELLDGVSVAG